MSRNFLKTIAQVGLPAILSLALLWYAVRGLSAREFWSALQTISPGLLVLMLVFPFFSMVLRAWRWYLLLAPVRALPFRTVFAFTNIGFMANNLLPAHAGEVVKPFLLARKTETSVVATFATVFLERLWDMAVMIGVMLWVILAVPLPTELKWAGGVMGGAGILLMISMFFLSGENSPVLRALLRVFRFLPANWHDRLGKMLETFLAGVRSLRRGRAILLTGLLTLMIWGGLVANIAILLDGFPGSPARGGETVVAAAAVLVVLVFAIALPTSPGYFGVTQAAFWIVLQQFGYNQTVAVGCSIVFNLTQYLTITGLGLFYLVKEGFGWRQLVGASHAGEPLKTGNEGT
ncbi:MAG TPA: lysylphosphatidylglycerol synthase transmembrane domain-containing protein [Calditrichia bacterium]|nr:flippase-like domain-containing protein [Calditrichota bacterium]HQU72640.1 lysylphosphatidylglycerol synthase transmembrane domain-containing protein [Calditrichia bacterium]HQV33115.1 lysylphosphatidylglycerol synthase transmembrane domain-containing protein [Calditrichia bacterium]